MSAFLFNLLVALIGIIVAGGVATFCPNFCKRLHWFFENTNRGIGRWFK